MARFCFALVAGLLIAGSSVCYADITSLSITAGSYAVHADVSSNPSTVFYQTATGVPHSFTSPLTLSSPGTMNYLTQSTNGASVIASTSTLFDYRSSFAGEANSYGSPNGVMTGYAEVLLGTTINFTLDTPGTVQLFSTNTVSNLIPGSNQSTAQANKWMQLNGVFVHATFADGAYSINVGAGSHAVDLSERVFASFSSSPLNPTDSAYAYGVSRSRVLITSVPEPTSLALVPAIIALGARRKRSR